MPSPPARTRFQLPFGLEEEHAVEPYLRRLGILAGLIVLLVAGGAVGFALTEGTSLWDGLNWSVDTIATIGSIPAPETTGGEIVKLALIVFGVGTLFYALVTVAEFFVAGHLSGFLGRRRTVRMIDSLSDHYLICGFGRVGRQVARDLQADRVEMVVIDPRSDNRERAEGLGIPFILGSASDDGVLRDAGLDRACAVVACADSDAENVFIALTAREVNPDATIIARAGESASEPKLRRAGADRVVSPYKTSGSEMARLALHPQVPVKVDVTSEYRIEEIEVQPECPGAGRRLGDVRGEATIVGIRDPAGELRLSPDPDGEVEPGSVLIAIGSDEAMDRLESEFQPEGREPEESHPRM